MNYNGHRLCADMLEAFTQKIWCEVLREEEGVKSGRGRGMWEFIGEEGEFLAGDGEGEYIPRVRPFLLLPIPSP